MIAFLAAATFLFSGASADAKPSVQLKLNAELVHTDSKGVQTLTPVDADQLKDGDVVQYDIVATNGGTDPALKLMPVGKIPSGTQYEAGTASSSGALRVEFSIDGGKTWSTSPTIRVETPSGVVARKADPATYTTIRWVAAAPLAPKASVTYHYQVKIK